MGKEEEYEEEEEEEESDEEVEIWKKHYSSKQRILLVGEGDLSFALCLATAFASARNIVATSLDTQGTFMSRNGFFYKYPFYFYVSINNYMMMMMIRGYSEEVQ
jgi:hypothetical protein